MKNQELGFQHTICRASTCKPAATPAQLSVHNNFRQSVRTLKKSLLRSIYFLRLIRDGKIHKRLGYSSILDYAAAEADLSPRQCKAFLALGKRLNELPRISADLENGQLSWRQAEEISRVATRETERVWIETARAHSLRELETRVRTEKRLRPGGDPKRVISADDHGSSLDKTDDSKEMRPPTPAAPMTPARLPTLRPAINVGPPLPADSRHHMTFRFTTEQLAFWEAWLAEARRQDATATKETLMCRSLGRSEHEHEWRLRTVLLTCPACSTARIPTSRGDVLAPKPLIERADCMGEIQDPNGRVTRRVSRRLVRRVFARDGHRCRAAGCRHTRHLEVHHVIPVSRNGATSLDNLVTLCSACHRRLHEGERILEAQLDRAP